MQLVLCPTWVLSLSTVVYLQIYRGSKGKNNSLSIFKNLLEYHNQRELSFAWYWLMWEPLSVKVTVFYVVFKILGKYRIVWLLGALSENLGNIIWPSAILLFLSWSTFPPLVISTYLFFKIPLHISFILIFSNREMLVNQIHIYLLLDSLWISLLEYNKCNVPLCIH